MRDIVDVRKVYKDGNLNRRFVGLVTLHLLPVAIPSGSCQKRKEEKLACRCFSITRYQWDIVWNY